jgi:hypothetical protein
MLEKTGPPQGLVKYRIRNKKIISDQSPLI